MLLDARADVNLQDAEYPSPLITARGYGNMKIAALLIERGANIQANGIKDNEYAWGNIEVFADYTRLSALHAACVNVHYEISRMLLLPGANTNQSFGSCATPNRSCCLEWVWGIVELLLDFGAKVYDPPDVTNVLVEAVRGHKPKRQLSCSFGSL